MAKIYGRLGEIVRLLKSQQEVELYGDPPEFDDVIEFDPITNDEVIAGLDTDWNSHTIDKGQLFRNGVAVVINPPGEDWVAEETAILSRTGWRDLGDWATWTPQEAELGVRNLIFDGTNLADLETWVSSSITGTNVTQLRTQLIAALKIIVREIVTVRTVLSIVAKVIMYIRDILIKRL